MANSVDNRVVKMEFDNAQFQQGVSATLESIKNLDKSLLLENGEKGLKGVQQAAENMGLDKVAADVESLNSKFSVFGVAAASVISRITDQLFGMAQSMVSAFTIDPIKDGFKEYELQLNSVQTILTNTKKYGTTIEDVNETLGELNEYADLTIYNFGDMTRSIGQFTQAGLDLETSTTAIKGMSNLAAGSGAGVQDLSRAMYQLSQALAAGKVQLMDWRSMINANMGSKTFQDSLMMVAREFGTGVDEAIAKQGDFNQSLKEGWLTTEVMVETLNRLTVEGAMALDEATVSNKDYWVEQAKSFEDAATKIKTFPQLIDVIKEEAGSGWATSWTYIMGNFEEAKELFTAIGTPITTFIGQMHDARNEVLKFWHDVQEGEKYSGRDYLLQGLGNIVEAIHSIVAPIADAFADMFSTVKYVTDEFGHSNAVLSDFGQGVAQRLVDISKGFAEVTKGLKLGEGYYKSVKLIFTGIFGALRIVTTVLGEGFVAAVGVAGHALEAFVFLLNLVFNVVTAIGTPLVHLAQSGFSVIGNALGNIFGSLESLGPKLKPIAKFIEACANAIGQFLWDLSNGKPVLEAWETLTHKFGVQWDALGRSFGPLVNGINEFVGAVKKDLTPQTDELGHVVQNTYSKVSAALGGVKDFLSPVVALVKELISMAGSAANGVGNLVSGISSGKKFDTASFSGFSKVAADAKDMGKSIADGVGKAKDAIVDFVSNIKIQDVIMGLSAALTGFIAVTVAGILRNLKKLTGGATNVFSSLTEGTSKFVDGLAEIPDKIGGAIEAYGKQFETIAKAQMLGAVADIIKSVALAIAALAISLYLLSKVDPERLKETAATLGVLMAAIVGLAAAFVHFTPVENIKQLASLLGAASGLVAIGGALILFAVAVKIFSTMDMEALGRGIVAIALIMTVMTRAAKSLNALSGDLAGLTKAATSIMILAMALGAVATACVILNFVDWTSLVKAGAILASFIASAKLLSMISNSSGSFLKLAASIGIFAVAFVAFGAACAAFTLVPILGIIKAIIALTALTVAVHFLAKTAQKEMKGVLALVGMMLGVSAAMTGLAVACAIFSTVSPTGMLAAAGALAGIIIAVAALSQLGTKMGGGMEKAAASLTAMAIGMAIFAGVIITLGSVPWQVTALGIGMLAVALLAICGISAIAGLSLVSKGLAALSSSVAMIGVGIGAVGLGMLAFAAGLATLASMSPAACAAIIEAFKAFGLGIIEVFKSLGIAIAEGAVALVKGLADAAPRFIAAGRSLLLSWNQIVSSGLLVEMGRVGGAMIIQFLAGLGETVGALVAGGALLIVSILTGIAQHIGEIVNAGLQVAIAFINGVSLALRSNSGPIWDAIANLLGSIFLFFVEGIAKIAELIPGVGQDCANKIREAGNSLVPAMEETTDAVVDAANPDGQISEAYGEEMSDTGDVVAEGGLGFVDTLKDYAGQAAAEAGLEFGEFPEIVGETMGDANTVISDAEMADITGGQAKEAVAAFRTEIAGLADTATDAVGSGLKALTSADFKSPASKQGSDANAGFKSGISNDSWRAAAASAAAAAKGALGSANLYSSGSSVGQDIGNGLIAGINSKRDEVYQAGYRLGQAAVQGKKDGAGSHSPSVYAIETGRNIGEGLVIGMHQMIDSVYSSGKDLGASATSAVSLAANALDGIDWNANPTITPVLDTSMIDAGLARAFGGNQMLSAGMVASKYALSAGAANDISTITNGGATYQFNLQYDAGTDALQMIQDMTRLVRQSSLTEGL